MANTFAEVILNAIKTEVGNLAPGMVIAKVKSIPPNLTLEYAGVEIYSEQIYCSNYLLPHYHRNYNLEGTNTFTHSYSSSDMSLAGSGPHKHNLTSSEGTGTIKSEGSLWLEDTLKVGDEVLVAIVGMFYVVITKISKMPSKAIEGV